VTGRTPDTRGQLVLLAAAVIAFALATGALAYLQVGSHPDIEPSSEEGSPERIVSALDRSVHNATASATDRYDWDDRELAVEELEDDLEPRVQTLRVSELEQSVVHEIAYDESDAAAWAANDCPSDPDRRFGDCEVIGGVVVQERAGETYILGVAFELRTTSEPTTHETSVRATGRQ